MRKKARKQMGFSNRMFHIFNSLFWVVVMLIILYPLYLVCIASVSDPDAIVKGEVLLHPVDFSLMGYEAVFKYKELWSSYGNSLFYTFVSVVISILVTLSAAYALSRPKFAGKGFLNFFFVFTMFFNGGLIPNFILMIKLKLYNTFWVYILPGMFTFYNMVIFMSFFRSIPESLMESARLDGASEFTVYWKIVMPNAKPVIATIGLFTAVYHWNDYYQGVVYIRDKTLEPLQTILYKLLAETSMTAQQQQAMLALGGTTTSATVKYAAMFVGALPILCLYPFIQKYLVKGVMLGAIKG